MRFDKIVHADWSTSATKRFQATTVKDGCGWRIEAPGALGPSLDFLDGVFRFASTGHSTLLGFDFPIGLPREYAKRTGFLDFKSALDGFGSGDWAAFYNVSDHPEDIAMHRPFYPHTPKKGVTRQSLMEGLGIAMFSDLLRACERRTSNRREACCLFWTLGGNAVGKAAITGWKEIVRPVVKRGALLWPFEGTLSELSAVQGRVVIAETYPAEAYNHIGIGFASRESKRRQEDRRAKADRLVDWAKRNGVAFSPDAGMAVQDGFGSFNTGEDRFDAFLGALGMIEVVEGRRPEGPSTDWFVRQWEGWILGQGSSA